MISLATEADRTLYFDFLPINIGTINGFAAKFQLYTVPGQVYYNATRKLVLRGVDGVVFVADSQPDKMEENIESLSNLEENLIEYGYDMNDLPMVIQYNKSDLPGILSQKELDERLNHRGRKSFIASATVGNGVFDTLKMIIKLVLEKAKNSASGKSSAPKLMSQPPADGDSSSTSNSNPAMDSTPAQVEQSMPSSSGSVATAAAPIENQEEDLQSRPYPGSVTGQIEQKKIVPASFTPTPDSDIENGSMGQKMLDAETKEANSKGTSQIAPTMAPPLRRRNHKKRGFFKRLFGMK
jgi:hypothetical protein